MLQLIGFFGLEILARIPRKSQGFLIDSHRTLNEKVSGVPDSKVRGLSEPQIRKKKQGPVFCQGRKGSHQLTLICDGLYWKPAFSSPSSPSAIELSDS